MTSALTGEVQERGDDGRWRTVRLGEVRVTDRRRATFTMGGRTFEADGVTLNGVDITGYLR